MSEYISEVCQKYEIDFTRTDEISKLIWYFIRFALSLQAIWHIHEDVRELNSRLIQVSYVKKI